jgi:AraC-like DNA-binding protein
MRQPAIACPRFSAPVNTLTYDFPNGQVVPLHYHHEDQLVYASRGVMSVQTGDGTWVVPPQRAVWIPAKIPHSIMMSGSVSMRTLYLRARLAQGLPRNCCVVNVSSLLKELILHACTFPALTKRVRVQARLIDVILDQLETVQSIPLQLPNPSDARAVRVAKILSDDPSDPRPLEEICQHTGASKRTIERLFHLETHMTLGEWRRQLRLLQSMRLLAADEKITHVALEAGYSTPSSFIAMFRKVFGTTPGRYFEKPNFDKSRESKRLVL